MTTPLHTFYPIITYIKTCNAATETTTHIHLHAYMPACLYMPRYYTYYFYYTFAHFSFLPPHLEQEQKQEQKPSVCDMKKEGWRRRGRGLQILLIPFRQLDLVGTAMLMACPALLPFPF